MAQLLIDIVVPVRPFSRLRVDCDVARLVRRAAVLEGRSLSNLLHDALVAYITARHPTWPLVYRDER
jgi:hypothetical protein